ncbi:MAG: TetR/AcrR family transcriptional regulator [Limisphaerales bacterium]
MLNRTQVPDLPETKRKLVDAGVKLMRACGFNATTVDEICEAAGVTKGGFFHYFKSKEDIAKAAVTRFYERKAKDFQDAPFRKLADPLDRVFGRLDFAKEAAGGDRHLTKGCLIGMFAQELSFTNPELRRTCRDTFSRIAEDFEADLAEAKRIHAPKAGFNPKNLAMLYVSIVQGSLMLSKASGSNDVLLENIEQFRSYLQNLFGRTRRPGGKPAANVLDNARN